MEDAVAHGASISAANLAEALSKLAERGADPSEVLTGLQSRGVVGGLLGVQPLTIDDALAIAELRPATKEHGLSLGDRACLALGLRLGLPVVTADRAWVALESVIDGVQIQSVR